MFRCENLKDKDHSEDLGVYKRIILNWILKQLDGLDSSGSGHGPVADSCEHGNEPSGSHR
jgi:hypothetical protein